MTRRTPALSLLFVYSLHLLAPVWAIGVSPTRTDFNPDRSGQVGHTTAYDYDLQTSRLLTVTADAAHPSLSIAHAPRSLSFTYDDAGQRLTAATLDTLDTFGI